MIKYNGLISKNLNDSFTFPCYGCSYVNVELVMPPNSNLTFEGTNDKSNFHLLTLTNNNDFNELTTIIDDGNYSIESKYSFIKVKTILQGSSDGKYNIHLSSLCDNNIQTDTLNNLNVNIKNPLTAFQELTIARNIPYIQIDALYGLLNTDVDTFVDNNGTVSVENNMFTCKCNETVGGYGVIRSHRRLKYRPGQGSLARFTAQFDNGVADSLQLAGLFNSYTGLWFGFDGANYGVCRRSEGSLEIQTLTITNGCSSEGNITITLDGTSNIIAVSNGDIRHAAYEISIFNYGNEWDVYQIEDKVIFQALNVGNKIDTFSFVDTDTTSISASFSESQQGKVNAENWVYKSNWNLDLCDGSNSINNPSGFNIDPTKLNVYQICFQYLGAGSILFMVENSLDGSFIPVHQIQYANNFDIPSLENPNMPIGYVSASLGSTTNLTVQGASMSGYTQGEILPVRNPRAFSNTKLGVSTTLTNILSFRVSPVFLNKINQREIIPITLDIASDGTKSVIIELRINSDLGGEPNWNYIDELQSNVDYDISSTTVINGNLLSSFVLSKADQTDIDLSNLRLRLERKDILTIAARTISSTSDISCAMSFFED